MANNGSYSNDRPASAAEQDSATDPASGSFFHSDYKKHEDLKQMLDSSKDSLKLEAMKRIIGMVAKGRDASDLFPAVVKNVVSKNIEVKKLVYVYLVRYAEEQQDLALLSISTFQRALKDPNQLIRASALRVLSSIRVTMIVPIVMLAIKDSASDMSPYVRKTAAHAIPKLYSLDPEQKEELLHVIEKLLSDKTTLVVGSAVMAFEEVCPERIDLIHKNYRKLCNLLVDVDEWGQVVIINMLTRYARTQFCNPNQDDVEEEDEEKPFYDDEDDDDDKGGGGDRKGKNSDTKNGKKTYSLDADHRLLLRAARPLLQSRNASVVMGVAQLYHHLAPRGEVIVVAKALIRLLRSHREVQSIVLNCIASMSTQRKSMFEPFLKSFFVRTSDPTHIKLLKLEIVTNLATESSIAVILREFQTYISSTDKTFVAATIQAIGRCASNIKEVTDTCLSGLVSLLSNRDEAVVGESVVVIKRLLQTQPAEHSDIIAHMARLVDNISVPAAKASILWLLGEYSDRVPRIAPDVLRKMAKSFINEEDVVKLQVLNLAVKLVLVNPQQTKLLCQYVLSLARYDSSYDIRDRARLLKQFVFPSNENSRLVKHAKKIFLATKPAPVSESQFKDREQFQMGSLSHYINARAVGYHDLAPFPAVAPDSSVRDVSPPHCIPEDASKKMTVKRRKMSYSDTSLAEEATEDWDSSGDDSDSSDSSSEDSSEDSSEASSEDSSDSSDSSDEDDDSSSEESTPEVAKNERIVHQGSEEKSDSSSDSKIDSDESSEESDSGSDPKPSRWTTGKSSKKETNPKGGAPVRAPAPLPKSNLDLLLDLDDIQPTLPVLTPSLGGFLSPVSAPQTSAFINDVQVTGPSFVSLRSFELVNKVSGSGLCVAHRFTRSVHLFSPRMASIELTLTNGHSSEMRDIQVATKNLQSGMALHEFAPVAVLGPNSSVSGTIGVDWNDSTQPAGFTIQWNEGEDKRSCNVAIKPAIGELLRPVTMTETKFTNELGKLRGMNEHSCEVENPYEGSEARLLSQRIYEIANVASVPSTEVNVLRYAGQTLASQSLVLVTARVSDKRVALSVNCEKMVVGSMLLNDIRTHLRS